MGLVIGYEYNGMLHANELSIDDSSLNWSKLQDDFDLTIDRILENSATYAEFGQEKTKLIGFCHSHFNHGSWFERNNPEGLKLYDLDIALLQKMEKKCPTAIAIVIDIVQAHFAALPDWSDSFTLRMRKNKNEVKHEYDCDYHDYHSDKPSFDIFQLTNCGRSKSAVLQMPNVSVDRFFYCHKSHSHHESYYQSVSDVVHISYSVQVHLEYKGIRITKSITSPSLFQKENFAIVPEKVPKFTAPEVVKVRCKNCNKKFNNNRWFTKVILLHKNGCYY